MNEKPDLRTNKKYDDKEIQANISVKNLNKIEKVLFKDENIICNSQMLPKQIKRYCGLDETTKNVLKNAITKFNLSGRAYDRILKLARTIADLDERTDMTEKDINEALTYKLRRII